MPNVTETALEFARKHVRNFYASDFFPDPDEFDAVWAGWDTVLDHFKSSDAQQLGTTPEDMACAKATGGYRIVHQLQPLDTLAYTALASVIAPHLEQRRIAENEAVACSYRLELDDSGRFFKQNADGYDTYRARSVDLAETHSWVFLADIAGFYNHIYIHRVQGAVEALDRSLASVGADLHAFLINLNDRQSIGIPVGPAASIVLSELILNEIDQFLRAHRMRPAYTRYADDFRFYSKSRSDLEELWHDLSSFLYRAHRLTLANGKSRILATSEFRDEILSPSANGSRAEHAKILGITFADLANKYLGGEGESSAESARSTADKKAALEQLFAELLNDRELNIGLARHVLRRARSLRMRCIARPVIDNLEKLAPVIRDAGLYLNAVLNAKAVAHNSAGLERFLAASAPFARSSHLHYWAAWLLSGKTAAADLHGFGSFLESALPRFRARAARMLNQPAWVRDNRAEWQRWATWDRWSLLHAAELLPVTERRVWMDSVAKSPSLMDRLVAAKVRAL